MGHNFGKQKSRQEFSKNDLRTKNQQRFLRYMIDKILDVRNIIRTLLFFSKRYFLFLFTVIVAAKTAPWVTK